MDLDDDVGPLDIKRRICGQPQGRVQHRPVLGGVDPLAGQHRIAVLGDAGLLGQPHERVAYLVCQVVLGQVREQVGGT